MLNVEEDKEPVIIAMGREKGMHMLGQSNETLITRKEVQDSMRRTKARKAAVSDGCTAESLKSGRVTVTELSLILPNVCFVSSVVPVDWAGAYVVLLHKPHVPHSPNEHDFHF